MHKTLILVLFFVITLAIASNAFKIGMISERYSMGGLKILNNFNRPCIQCYDFSVKPALAILPNLTHDSGIMRTCGSLCDALTVVTGYEEDSVFCNATCEALGYKEFVKVIDNNDLDAVSYCDLGATCEGKTGKGSFYDELTRFLYLLFFLLLLCS